MTIGPSVISAEDASAIATKAEQLLLERAARGDADAFDLLLRPRLPHLYRVAVAILRSEPDARDAVQDACLHAWRAVPRLRERERFDAWLTRIVVNGCRSTLRDRKRGRVREIALDDASPASLATAMQGQTPGSDVGDVEVVQRAFEGLDPTARSLLVLHYMEERPLREIASLVGVPVGTVKWRLWRARHKLQRALEKERA